MVKEIRKKAIQPFQPFIFYFIMVFYFYFNNKKNISYE